MSRVTLTVNGRTVSGEAESRTSLADFLRETLSLTGTHTACEHGACGACTVMIDGKPGRSCITLAVAAKGLSVRTVEGYDGDPVMAVIRQCFKEKHGIQCGYCTPGMLATAYDVVTRLKSPDRARIKLELSGNLCRCTGYLGIVDAIELACARVKEAPHG
jgi:carbon-monoxide dehydrogenase small subunit